MAHLVVALWVLAAQPDPNAFFLALQQAAEWDDRWAVAALMTYPST